MNYKATIGLEVHVQLATRTKMFCACNTDFGSPPNTHVCPVCLGYPGALPVINEAAVRLTVITGLMLGSEINPFSKFDRKNYFYPDMPKNYQISQYDRPLCIGGAVAVEVHGVGKKIPLIRIHLEEDVAKNMHVRNVSSIDFNRAGHPLMEVVTEPELDSPEEAFAFLQALKQILLYGGVSPCNLEEGNLRCDVNCSVRPVNRPELGVKTEIKNLNTFKGVFQSLQYEINRQTAVLESGGTIVQETRRWETETGITESMRSKEMAHDYRYFPDPDLMPVVLSPEQIESWKALLPELPRQRCDRLVQQYGIPLYDAGVLSADKALADYFEESCRYYASRPVVPSAGANAEKSAKTGPKAISNWLMTEMLRLLSEKEMDIERVAIRPKALAELVCLTEAQVVNSNTAKQVFAALFEQGGDPEQWVKQQGLAQVSDAGAIETMVAQAMADHAGSVAAFRAGKSAALQFLVGQVMRASKGKANPQRVQELLKKKLTAPAE